MLRSSIKQLSVLWTICLFSQPVSTQSDQPSLCVDIQKCDECIGRFDCSWCSDTAPDQPHCNTHTKHNLSCQTYHPQSTVSAPAPRMNVTLRAGQPVKWSVTHSLPASYNVDLYLLMDSSKSMDNVDTTQLGDQLLRSLGSLTDHYRVGFGTFTGRQMLRPLVSDTSADTKSEYGFQNIVKLTNDTDLFKQSIRSTKLSDNMNQMDSGLDALVQVMVCGEQINWRPDSQRMIVYATNAPFLYAGDGRLSGITTPNDGKCNLTNDQYNELPRMDYPSVGHVNKLATEHSVSIIFASPQKHVHIYERLAAGITGSAYIELNDYPSGVEELVTKQYKKIRNKIELKHDAPQSYLKVEFLSNCNRAGPVHAVTECTDLTNGEDVVFDVQITLEKCPEQSSSDPINITIGSETRVVLDVATLCTCDCGVENASANVRECSGNGSFRCGVCDCDKGYFGPKCECKGDERIDPTQLSKKCVLGHNICSNRGTCKCGKCECHGDATHHIRGEYCEFDNFSCPRRNGELCSGNGKCVDNKCHCNSGFGNAACDCSTLEDNCKDADGEICSGHGDCECNACQCHTIGEKEYSGRFCEECIACEADCVTLKVCVHCLTHNADNATCTKDCEGKHIKHIAMPELVDVPGKPCTFYDDNDCRYSFVYTYDRPTKSQVVRTAPLACPPPIQTAGIVASTAGVIMAIGMMMMAVWKLLTRISDKREYARFKREQDLLEENMAGTCRKIESD